MIMALNGILIVAMLLAVGLAWTSKWLIALAFAIAGISYMINIIDHHVEQGAAGLSGIRNLLFLVTFGLGVVAYLDIAFRLL